MSRNRKLNRKYRTFHIETLERREVMSATGWTADDGDQSAANAASLTAYVATAEDQNLTPTHTERMLTTSATPAPTALVRAQQDVPYTVSKNGDTLQITATQAGYGIKAKNYFINPQTGKVTMTIEHIGPKGGPFAQTIDVTGITKIAYHGTSGNDAFDNDTRLMSEQWGYGGNDTLLGGSQTDILRGGSGNDHLNGRDGHDTLYGGKNGSIPIGSGAGRLGDELYGGTGNDTLDGGAGDDWLYGHDDNDTIIGRGGNDYIDGGVGNDTLKGGAGDDTLVAKDGTAFNDVIDGGTGNNVVVDDIVLRKLPDTAPEATLVNGRLVIQGGSRGDNVSVGLAGNEVVVNFNGREKRFAAASVKSIEFFGGKGNDFFTNNTSIAAQAYGEAGNDTLLGGSGRDVLRGGAGRDRLEGRSGNDNLFGDDHLDTLLGGAGDDRLYGGNHDDVLDGGIDNDRLEGGGGNDQLNGGDGRDLLFGQDGIDWLYGGFGKDELHGGLGADHLFGGSGDDRLFGGHGADILRGNEDNDYLDGEDGNDAVHGDHGNDHLVSRDSFVANDELFGGLGTDVFDAPMKEIKQR